MVDKSRAASCQRYLPFQRRGEGSSENVRDDGLPAGVHYIEYAGSADRKRVKRTDAAAVEEPAKLKRQKRSIESS